MLRMKGDGEMIDEEIELLLNQTKISSAKDIQLRSKIFWYTTIFFFSKKLFFLASFSDFC